MKREIAYGSIEGIVGKIKRSHIPFLEIHTIFDVCRLCIFLTHLF